MKCLYPLYWYKRTPILLPLCFKLMTSSEIYVRKIVLFVMMLLQPIIYGAHLQDIGADILSNIF